MSLPAQSSGWAMEATKTVVMEATKEAVKVVMVTVDINIFEAVKDSVVCSCIHEQLEVKN